MDRSRENTEIEALYCQYGPVLLLFACSITGERSRAQDAIHQVFLKLIENDSLAAAVDKKAYLFACVRNSLLNERKREERLAPLDADSIWFSPPSQDFAEEERLRRALLLLPNDQRQVIVLHIWGEMTFLQISNLLGISANTTASRYRYALDKLRDSMTAKENPCVNSR